MPREPRIRHLSLALMVALAVALAIVGNASAQSSEPPANVLVSPTEPDTSTRPWLARDPARSGRLAIAYNDPSDSSTCYLARSGDNGANWENAPVVGTEGQFPLPSGRTQCNRPSIAYGADGALYCAFSAITGGMGFPPPAAIFVMASSDGGETFEAPVQVEQVDPGTALSDINPGLAVDQESGRLYVVWQANLPRPANIGGASSGDGGKTFSPTVLPFPEGAGGPGEVAVGPDGRVYVTRRTTSDYAQSMGALPMEAEVASSTDGGRTFGEPVTGLRLRSCFTPDSSCQRNAQGAPTFNPSVSAAAGSSPGEPFFGASEDQLRAVAHDRQHGERHILRG